MTLSKVSTVVSVEDFFSNANWEGISTDTTIETEDNESLESKLSLVLTVNDFFALNNWAGLPSKNKYFKNIESEPEDESMFLTMSVTEFFQRMVWEGKPNIAPMPNKVVPINSKSKPSPAPLKLTDLSDLF